MKMNVTISRQYGSGGHEIGRLVAEKLGLDLYDDEVLALAAKDSGIDVGHFEAVDEKKGSAFLDSIALSGQFYAYSADFITNDKLFAFQSNAMVKAAEASPSLFVGRCADYVLRDVPNVLNVFVHADYDFRLKRIMEIFKLSEEDAKTRIKKKDKAKMSYYNFYAENKWGDFGNYDLAINSSIMGLEETANAICDFVKKVEANK